jgi:hypothetical protein
LEKRIYLKEKFRNYHENIGVISPCQWCEMTPRGTDAGYEIVVVDREAGTGIWIFRPVNIIDITTSGATIH